MVIIAQRKKPKIALARLQPAKARRFRRKLMSWARKNRRAFPWRKTSNPYRILVAEVMLQQTFARKVVPIYREFLRRYPSPRVLAQAKVSEIRSLILPLGFQYRSKLLKGLGQALVKKHGSAVPGDRSALLKLPGVGPYIANAVLCFAFGRKRPVVDTNVVRVFQRLFGAEKHLRPGETNKRIWELAAQVLPRRRPREFNIAVLDFAALLCTHYNPRCESCPLQEDCLAAPYFLSRLRKSKT